MIEALLILVPFLWAVWRIGPLDYDGKPLRGRRRALSDEEDEEA